MAYFDGPAGSQVPSSVAEAVSRYLLSTNANHGAPFATSQESDALLDNSHQAVADFLGTSDPDCITFGANMTTLTFALSRTLGRTWKPGDEILVTQLDHDANVTPWVLAAKDAGAAVKHIKVRSDDCTLDLDDFLKKLTNKTRLLAVGYASNATGTVNPVEGMIEAAHAVGAMVFVDAVHYAPHRLIDVTDLDCDFLAVSAYKFFGPHVGVLYGKREHLESLTPYKLRPATNTLPGKWMTGTQNHEGIAGITKAIEYLASLNGDRLFEVSRREALRQSYHLIESYEEALCRRLLSGLAEMPRLRIWGMTDQNRMAERVPTVSLTHETKTPWQLATATCGTRTLLLAGKPLRLALHRSNGPGTLRNFTNWPLALQYPRGSRPIVRRLGRAGLTSLQNMRFEVARFGPICPKGVAPSILCNVFSVKAFIDILMVPAAGRAKCFVVLPFSFELPMMKAYLVRIALCVVCSWGLAARSDSLHAAKPEVSGFYPAGGQIGQAVEVEVLGKLGGADVKVWCDQEGITGEATKDGKKLNITISPEAAPGICWIRVWNEEGPSAIRPFLVGRLSEVSEKEPNETLSAAQAMDASGTVVNGKLAKSGELDTFKVSLKQGETLVADVLANQVLSSPMDAVLQIASAKGFLLAQADDSPRFDPTLTFTAPADGDYFVRVFAFPTEPNSSIRYAGGENYIYRLTLTTGPYVRHVVPLSVSGNSPAPLLPKGWNLPANTPAVNVSELSDNLSAVLPFPGVMPLNLAKCDHPSLSEPETDKIDERKFPPPFSLTGTIAQADEVDEYQFSAKKDETLQVKVESAALGFPLDPVLEIRDAKGQSIRVVDDQSRSAIDAEYDFKAPADGEYQIQIKDRFQHGGWDYAYLLTVAAPKPSANLSVAADAFSLTKDKPVEIPVTIAKSNGFSEKLEVKVTGLPEGYTVETEAGGKVEEPQREGRRGRGRSRDQNQNRESVKLKITAKGDEPFHGPVWITAKLGEKDLTATTPTANASEKASHVWITYQPKK